MAIEHDFFGLIESGPDGSVFWTESVEFGDQRFTVDLTAPDELNVTPAALDAAAEMIGAIESLDRVARDSMLAEVDDRTSEVTEFILQQQEVYGLDGLEELLVDISGDVAVDVIRSLQVVSMTILADELGSTDPFAVLEYALEPAVADEVLLVNLTGDGTVLSVTSAQ